MPSFAESEYSIEDWIPVVEPFDEHPRLELRGGFEDYRDRITGDTGELTEEALDAAEDWELERLENPEDQHELRPNYEIEGTSGTVEAWYSPSARTEGNMLEGFLAFSPSISGLPATEVKKKIVDEYSTPYIEANEDLGEEDDYTLASIRVPENYDPETLEDTVQAIVDISDETQRFEGTVEETVEGYEIN